MVKKRLLCCCIYICRKCISRGKEPGLACGFSSTEGGREMLHSPRSAPETLCGSRGDGSCASGWALTTSSGRLMWGHSGQCCSKVGCAGATGSSWPCGPGWPSAQGAAGLESLSCPQSGGIEQLLGGDCSSHQCRDELNPVILAAALHIFGSNVSCQETVMCVFLYKKVFVLWTACPVCSPGLERSFIDFSIAGFDLPAELLHLYFVCSDTLKFVSVVQVRAAISLKLLGSYLAVLVFVSLCCWSPMLFEQRLAIILKKCV